MKKSILRILLIGLVVFSMGLTSCKKDETTTEPTKTDSGNNSTTDDSHVFNINLMNSNNLLESVSLVSAKLSDGSTADCYKLVFKSNPVTHGPYCPKTINDIGGVAIYDGATNPGFQVMKASLWNAMEADGYDIVDASGNINITDPGSGVPVSGSSCLEATANNNLKLTFFIPAVPKFGTANDSIDRVEHVGVSKDGIPLTGHPPSATGGIPGSPPSNFASIPSIDPCGGHIDPFGYYHLHFGAEEMNNVLLANNITEVTCTNFTQSETAFVGFAKDGFPIYASKDQDGTLPTDLDECQGHTSVTADYPNGVYHYHISSTNAPNLPTCLKGVSAQNDFIYE